MQEILLIPDLFVPDDVPPWAMKELRKEADAAFRGIIHEQWLKDLAPRARKPAMERAMQSYLLGMADVIRERMDIGKMQWEEDALKSAPDWVNTGWYCKGRCSAWGIAELI